MDGVLFLRILCISFFFSCVIQRDLTCICIFSFLHSVAIVDQDSSVGTATCYELDGMGIDLGGGEIFHTLPVKPWVPPSLLYNG